MKPLKTLIATLVAVLLVAGCSSGEPTEVTEPEGTTNEVEVIPAEEESEETPEVKSIVEVFQERGIDDARPETATDETWYEFKTALGVTTGGQWFAQLAEVEDYKMTQTEMEIALQTLLQMVSGIEHLTPEDAFSIASGVCEDLETGLVDNYELAAQLAENYEWEPEEAGFLVGASQMALCPGTVSDRTD